MRIDGRVVSMAVFIACGVNEEGKRDILAIEPMLDESKESYRQFFHKLIKRGLKRPALIIPDAHKGLVKAIVECFPGTTWQRCKVHFMRNIMAHVSHAETKTFGAELKEIWLAPTQALALDRAQNLILKYEKRFPKAIEILEDGLEDSLAFYTFPK